nr:hypothetical protein [Tanacetum cinerariifolium]
MGVTEFAESNVISDDDEEQQVREASQPKTGKRKATTSTHPFFTKGKNDASQPTIKKAMQTKEKLHYVDLAIAMWFYDACIPMNACNSPYFQHAVDKITTVGFGYKAPSYHALRVNLLVDVKKSVSLLINSYRSPWTESGCTIMSVLRAMLKICVICYSEIVEMVGVKNVVQMVIDNGANYKAVGILLSERYRTVTWSPCAAHCLNLVLKDVSELDNVKEIITLASRVTVFIYNHKWPLNWLRKRHGWTEIIRPVVTRFGIAFITLKSLVDHKNELQAMVISSDFKKMLRVKNALDCKQVIMNENFWNNCLITVRVMTPLLRLLRLCDSDVKPTLGYVYEGMFWARKGIKDLFKNKKDLYQPYTKIINERWDKMLRTNIHYLNKAIGMFQDSKGNFGTISAVQGRTKHRPVDYECIDETDFWVVEEVAQGELDYDQLENMLEQEPPSQTQGLVDEDDDDSEFHLLNDRELDAYNTPMSQ